MSYIRSTIKCDGCGYEMNVAFGIVGRTIIAAHPDKCPECAGKSLTKIAVGWRANGAADPLSVGSSNEARDNTQPLQRDDHQTASPNNEITRRGIAGT